MGFDITGLLNNVANTATGGLLGIGMGLLQERHNDQRQLAQQQALTNQQMQAQMALMGTQNKMQLQMWKDTNYAAQMEQLKNAGLNPGLLYGKGGGGGMSIGGGMPSAGSGTAQQNPGEMQTMMGMALQMEMQRAQIENLKADTQEKLANIPLKGEQTESLNLQNMWEQWKQSHNEEGYEIKDYKAYDRDGKEMPGQSTKTWKESENKMLWDKLFNEIDGIMKDNAIKEEQKNLVIKQIDEVTGKIELLKKQGLNLDEITNNLKKDGSIKDFEIEMNKVGLTHSSISDILKLLLYRIGK